MTGSDKAGRHIAAKAGEVVKKTVLELGSNDAYPNSCSTNTIAVDTLQAVVAQLHRNVVCDMLGLYVLSVVLV